MSYIQKPATPSATVPGLTDDSTKGYVAGSEIVVTSVTPNVIYKCSNPAIGAAVWFLLGSAAIAGSVGVWDDAYIRTNAPGALVDEVVTVFE